MPPFLFGYDFYYLWAVGALLHQGVDPYDLAALQSQLSAIGWPPYEVTQRFTHPMNSLWLYWLVAFVPFRPALAIWTVGSLASVVGCSLVLQSLFSTRRFVSSRLAVFAVMVFPPTIGNLIWGQMNSVLLVGVTMFAVMWTGGRYIQAGFWLSLVLLKPQNFIVFLLIVFFFELKNRRFGCLIGCGMGLALQVQASLLIAPNAVVWYQGALEPLLTQSLLLCGATVGQLVECTSDVRFLRPSLVVCGALVSLWVVHRRGYSLSVLLSVVLPLSVSVSPYCWMHTFVVLIPSVLLLMTELRSRISEPILRYGLVCVALLSLPFVLGVGHQIPWILLSWGLVAAGVLWSSRYAAKELGTVR